MLKNHKNGEFANNSSSKQKLNKNEKLRKDSFSIKGMPAITKKRPQQDAGGPNWKETVAARGFQADLDPESQVYNVPDFGFDDELNFSKSAKLQLTSIWYLLFDHI